jgi:tetratricopeptide (TPR) repeat protein
MHRGDCERACEYFEKALKHYFESPNPHWFGQYFSTSEYPFSFIETYLGALIKCGYYDLALEVSQNHLEESQALAWKARVRSKFGDRNTAINYLNKAIEKDSQEPGLRAEKASQLLLNENPVEAEKEIQIALKMSLDKGNYDPWLLGILAVSWIEQNRQKEALEYLLTLKDEELQHVQASIIHNLAKLGRWKDVIAWSEEVLRKNPDEPSVLKFLASAFVHTKRFGEASEIYSKLLEIQPYNIQLQLEMASAYEKSDDKENAKQMFKRILLEDKLSRPQKLAASKGLQRLM